MRRPTCRSDHQAYIDNGALPAAFLARKGMPTMVASIRREHVEAVHRG